MTAALSELLLDLLVAAVLGAAVGIQRQAAQKSAGFRTHLLVALASCAFAEVGRLTGDDRITANVLTGIGFLGAGAIFRSGYNAHGLTTAASIWTVAAIGVAVGYGHPSSIAIAVVVTIVTVVALSISDAVFTRVFPLKATLTIVYAGDLIHNPCAEIFARYRGRYESTGESRVTNSPQGRVTELHYHLVLPAGSHLARVLEDLAAIPGVQSVMSDAPVANAL